MELKVGTRVKCKRDIASYSTNYKTKGVIGRIVCIDDYDFMCPYGIEFNEPIFSRCNCDGHGKDDYCLWLNGEDIIPFNLKQRLR